MFGPGFKGLRRGQRVRFSLYAGRGLRGPEYRPATGRVHLVFPTHVVVTLPGDKRGAMPVVVNEENFLSIGGGS